LFSDNFFLFCSYTACAQTIPAVLFLTQAITSAIAHNPELQRLRSQAEITQAEARSSSTVQNPYFTFDADPLENDYRFGLQKAFETGGSPKWAGRASLKRAEIERARLETATVDLKRRVTSAYTNVYINQEKVIIYKEKPGAYIS
jgi:outer membrane protein TolC